MHWHLNDSHCFKVKLLDLQAAEMQLAEMKFHLHAFDWTLDLGWALNGLRTCNLEPWTVNGL